MKRDKRWAQWFHHSDVSEIEDRAPTASEVADWRRVRARSDRRQRLLMFVLTVVLAVVIVIQDQGFREQFSREQAAADDRAEGRRLLLEEIRASEAKLECYASYSTELDLVLADILDLQIELSGQGGELPPEAVERLKIAQERLEEFKRQATAGDLSCENLPD